MIYIIIYDDTGKKSEVITDIIGEKGFADVVIKKKRVEEYYHNIVLNLYPHSVWKLIQSISGYVDIIKDLERYNGMEVRILHCFANYFITDEKKVLLTYEKLPYIDQPYKAMQENRTVAIMFPNVRSYLSFCNELSAGLKPWDAANRIEDFFEIEGIVDIGVTSNFIQCITGNFDSRYFNSLNGDEYTIVKRSANKKKIKSEYTFYHLLPDDMKFWFVMPFHYIEDQNFASYTMEHYHMTDLAIKWVHGSIDEAEFEFLMEKYFYFFMSRHSRNCQKEEYRKIAESLYTDKVIDRIEQFKNLPEYHKIAHLLDDPNGMKMIDDLVKKYFILKEKIEEKNDRSDPLVSVIGHGDPCFANALYSKSTRMLKFIDPKGALTEEELWTNPYYDIAKLSHSVCGRYDFFNHALFDIRIDEQFSLLLEIPFDNSKYVDIFKKKTEENGFNFLKVRLYEASLFLSMLPLHKDHPFKILGFILNVKNILEELERNV